MTPAISPTTSVGAGRKRSASETAVEFAAARPSVGSPLTASSPPASQMIRTRLGRAHEPAGGPVEARDHARPEAVGDGVAERGPQGLAGDDAAEHRPEHDDRAHQGLHVLRDVEQPRGELEQEHEDGERRRGCRRPAAGRPSGRPRRSRTRGSRARTGRRGSGPRGEYRGGRRSAPPGRQRASDVPSRVSTRGGCAASQASIAASLPRT